MMFLTSSILMGFVRLCFILLFLFYLNRKFVSANKHLHFMDFIVLNWFRYAALLVISLFVLIEASAYNLFNCIFIFALILAVDIIGLENLKRPRVYFRENIKTGLLTFLRNVENQKTFGFWFRFNQNKKKRKQNTFIFLLTIVLGITTFLSRYYFIIYDNYSLSDAWINDLNNLIQFDNQYWFTFELTTDAELALANFYGKITDVSPTIALQVIAILESTLLAIVIFWVIHKLTPSKFIAPSVAALFFSLVYVLTPLNVYFLLKGNPTFLALTFALPAFVMYLQPNILHAGKWNYFWAMTAVFIAIGLTDIFTLCILIPPFLVLAFFFTKLKNKRYNLIALSAFIVAIIILTAVYQYACYYQRIDFTDYLQNNLLSVSSYTYVPQLIVPYSEIIRYAQWSTVFGFAFAVLLALFKKENVHATLAFYTYFNFLILLTFIRSEWLDIDMLNNSLSVFIPIVIGLNIALVMRLFHWLFPRLEKYSPLTVIALYGLMLYAAVFYQQKGINALTVSDQTPKQILNAYDKISQTFFAHSYCVVNDPATQVISNNSHFFMNYDFFINDYPRIDSINTQNRKDPMFLVKHPEYSLAKSVLVFVLSEDCIDEKNVFAENKHYQSKLIDNIKLLRRRGRTVNLFYKSKILKVYEIVNAPKQSKISDLIF